jgi:capsular polysaccharide biosynthesis protein
LTPHASNLSLGNVIREHLADLKFTKIMLKKMYTDVTSSSAALIALFVVTASVFLLLFISVTIITFILPEAYASTAWIRINTDAMRYSDIENPSTCIFNQADFEVIGSDAALDKVIDSLNLSEVWAKKYNLPQKFKTSESRSLLRRMIEFKLTRNTLGMNITVYSEDKTEAARIANAIAEAYQAYCQTEATAQPDVPGGSRLIEIPIRATPNDRPARPNKSFNILFGGVISMLIALAAGTITALIVGRLTRRSAKPTV